MAVEAIWNDQVIAHSDKTVVVEGNHYFPREDVDPSVLERSATTSECPWKGTAHYYTIDMDGERNEDAAWYYPEPKPEAENIRDHIAFWNGVEIVEESSPSSRNCASHPIRKAAGSARPGAPRPNRANGPWQRRSCSCSKRTSAPTGTRSTPPRSGCGTRAIRCCCR